MDSINKYILEKVNIHEIYRYLGYGKNIPDDIVKNIISEVLEQLSEVIKPKNIYKIYDCCTTQEEVRLNALTFKSKNLADNLKQCKKAALFAATLGLEADKLMQRYEIINMAKATVTQACAAACIEAYCNIMQEEILSGVSTNEKPLYLRPRFSAGYGDLELSNQRIIFDELECTKRIGLTLTDSLLMFPTKSVTAFIGFTDNPQSCHINKCKTCNNIGCEFRNE